MVGEEMVLVVIGVIGEGTGITSVKFMQRLRRETWPAGGPQYVYGFLLEMTVLGRGGRGGGLVSCRGGRVGDVSGRAGSGYGLEEGLSLGWVMIAACRVLGC